MKHPDDSVSGGRKDLISGHMQGNNGPLVSREGPEQVSRLGVEASDDSITTTSDNCVQKYQSEGPDKCNAINNTQSLVELDDGHAHGVAFVDNGVVAKLGDPTLGHSVL